MVSNSSLIQCVGDFPFLMVTHLICLFSSFSPPVISTSVPLRFLSTSVSLLVTPSGSYSQFQNPWRYSFWGHPNSLGISPNSSTVTRNSIKSEFLSSPKFPEFLSLPKFPEFISSPKASFSEAISRISYKFCPFTNGCSESVLTSVFKRRLTNLSGCMSLIPSFRTKSRPHRILIGWRQKCQS